MEKWGRRPRCLSPITRLGKKEALIVIKIISRGLRIIPPITTWKIKKYIKGLSHPPEKYTAPARVSWSRNILRRTSFLRFKSGLFSLLLKTRLYRDANPRIE